MTAPTCYCAGCIGMGPCDNPIQSDECGNCALEADHFGPCAWICSGCGGTGKCPGCKGSGGEDDVQLCEYCEGGGRCLSGCEDGLVSND